MRLSIYLLVSTCFLASMTGCQQDREAKKEKFIQDMLSSFADQKKEVIKRSNGVYEDVRVYREGKSDVVVFERKLSKEYEAVLSGLKPAVIKELKSSEASKKALELGIQFRMIEKKRDGTVVSDFVISREDL